MLESSKIYFYYMSFLFNTFLVNLSDLPFVFTKKSHSFTFCILIELGSKKAAKKDTRIL